MYFLISPNLHYAQLIVPNVLRGFGMAVLFIGIWVYALGNLPADAMLGAAAVLIIVRTMIDPGVWSLAINDIDSIWNLEAFTNVAGQMDASSLSQQSAVGFYKTIKLDALMISTKRIYGVLVLIAGAVLVYVSFLNLEGLDKRSLIKLKKKNYTSQHCGL